MPRCLVLSSVLFAFTLPLFAQDAPVPPTLKVRPQPTEPAAAGASRLTLRTQLVAVDVVVEDRDGHPVQGLKPSDFRLDESKKPQTVKTFEEHAAADQTRAKAEPHLNLPPGTFTDYTPLAADSTLNILLLDTLNTPTQDQSYVHYQLHEYLKHAVLGERLAIFGLSSHLVLLQGFTSDPEVLRAAVEHKTSAQPSNLSDNPSGSGSTPQPESVRMAEALAGGPGDIKAIVGAMQQFEAETASYQVQVRAQLTLEAFNQIARYLGAFPGRKNLIWFSGSFPLTIFPDAGIPDPMAVVSDSGDALRQTSNLLARSRIAVYPIDARGLQSGPLFDASRTSRYAVGAVRNMKDTTDFNTVTAEEHATMEQVAEDTGGHAFYNTNGLANAVTKALDAGSNFYTLTYSPTDHDQKGGYREIRLQLQGEAASRKLKLAYRHGYYADDNINPTRHDANSILSANLAAPPPNPRARYGMAVMQRGAPAPSEVIFKVRVLPDSNVTEASVAPKNQLDPQKPVSGPFRLFNVEFSVLGSTLQVDQQPDGKRAGVVEFVTYVFDVNGKLLNVAGDTLRMNITPEVYSRLLQTGLGFSLKVSAPAKGESFLRIAVHDLASGRFGVVEIPSSNVAALAPLPRLAEPSAAHK